MRTTLRIVAAAACLASLALVGACGSKPTGTTTSAAVPPTLTRQSQAETYCKALIPVYRTEWALYVKVKRFRSVVETTNAFSFAARINDSFLPLSDQGRTRLAAITPPPLFRAEHRRLERVFALQSDFLYFLQDEMQRANYTGTVDPTAFFARADRYVAQIKAACRVWEASLRIALKRSGVKKTPRPLRELMA